MNISLRALEPEDADFMYEAESDPFAWEYSDYLAPLSREQLRQYALTYDADPFSAGQLRLVIEAAGAAVLSEVKNPAGIIDLFDISPRHLRADTGIYILPEFRGKGIGAEALRLTADFARRRLALHQLTATVADTNPAALACYRKAGFTLTATHPDWLRTHTGFIPAHRLHLIL